MRPVDVMELASEFPYKKELPKGDPGRFVYLQQLTFGAVKLAVATSEDPYFQPESWDYPNLPLAREALAAWNGKGKPMAGWTRRTDLDGNHYPKAAAQELTEELESDPELKREITGE